MKPVKDTYGKSFFSKRHKLSWRVPIVCNAIKKTFDLKKNKTNTILDVGCAIGDYVEGFQKMGLLSCGWEGSEEAIKYSCVHISIVDMRKQLENKFMMRWDVCMSLEVAEHIEPEYSHIYVKNLCSLSDCILITAAPPGQGGHGHCNCQEKKYWNNLFKEHGYFRSIYKEQIFINKLSAFAHRKEINVYAKNVIVFLKYNKDQKDL